MSLILVMKGLKTLKFDDEVVDNKLELLVINSPISINFENLNLNI